MDTVSIADGIPQNSKYVLEFNDEFYDDSLVLVKIDLNDWWKNFK